MDQALIHNFTANNCLFFIYNVFCMYAIFVKISTFIHYKKQKLIKFCVGVFFGGGGGVLVIFSLTQTFRFYKLNAAKETKTLNHWLVDGVIQVAIVIKSILLQVFNRGGSVICLYWKKT